MLILDTAPRGVKSLAEEVFDYSRSEVVGWELTGDGGVRLQTRDGGEALFSADDLSVASGAGVES